MLVARSPVVSIVILFLFILHVENLRRSLIICVRLDGS